VADQFGFVVVFHGKGGRPSPGNRKGDCAGATRLRRTAHHIC
jgi:hypothetical protein